MTSPRYHPHEEQLAAYASGACGIAEELLLASHASLCGACDETLGDMESLGGALLGGLPETELPTDLLGSVLHRLDDVPVVSSSDTAADAVFPMPLRIALGFSSDRVPWRSVSGSLSLYSLSERSECTDDVNIRLMRIKAGKSMPEHTHGGREMTLVLSGGFSDHRGHYLRGDVSLLEAGAVHSPTADRGVDCICLAINEGAVQLNGWIGRLISPLLKF